MTLDDILAQVVRYDGRLLVDGDDRLRVDAPEGAISPELLGEIRTNKAALLAQLRLQQQMCFNLVNWAVETVAEEYPPGCLDVLGPHQRETVRKVEVAMDAAALAGDIDATDETTGAYVTAWKRAIREHSLVADVLSCSIDAWCARPDKPTIVLDTPHGEVLLVADRDTHARSIEAGKVVFSPLEIEQLIAAESSGLVDPELIRALIATKRAMPGSRLEDVRKPNATPEAEELEPTESLEPPPKPAAPSARPREQKKANPKPAEQPAGQLSLLGDG